MGISMLQPKNEGDISRPVGDSNQPQHDSPSVDIPVLIIGGGPTGLFQAHLLSQLGGTLRGCGMTN